jgi:hypothetical protein
MPQPIWFTAMLEKLPPDALEDWGERAAIIQYDAGYDRGHAECLALLLIVSRYKLIL